MNALDLLLQRQSDPLLTSPAPSKEQVTSILTAGMRVPDHAALTPFHFTIVEEGSLDKLSDVFVGAISEQQVDQAKLDKTAKMPKRAPLIIIVSTKYQQHEKVPKQEQLITAGCCVHAMQMAAVTLGFGAMWRTGELSYNDKVKKGLNIEINEDIVGFLYIGSKAKTLPKKETRFYENRVSYL